jgi:hypothetical protein
MSKVSSKNTAKKTTVKGKRTTKIVKKLKQEPAPKPKEGQEDLNKASYAWKIV